MEHPYGEQYSQEGNPRAYMTMRDYRNLPYQWQQPVGRNPNPPRSMREYRDQWMSAPVYSVPSTYPPPPQYDHPEPPFYASTPQSPQSQQPPPLSPVEQAILNLSKVVGTFVEEQKILHVQTNQRIEAVESSVNRKLDNMHAEISKLSNQQLQYTPESGDTFWPWKKEEQTSALISEEESQGEECLSDTMVEEQCQQHPLLEPSDIAATVCPWENHTALLSEESSGHETGKESQEPIFQPIPMKMNPSATAQPNNNRTANAKTTNNPLPVAPSDDQVYILPTPAEKSKPAAPAPKGKSNPSLHAMQNFKELVAIAQIFATTSKKMETAYIAWHSGWFWCGFGFGASEPRHF